MKKNILLSIALVAACSLSLFAQPVEPEEGVVVASDDSEAILPVDAKGINDLRFRLTKKEVRGVVKSEVDSVVLAGAGVVYGQDTIRTAGDGSFVLTLPFDQDKVSLTVFPKEVESGKPEFGTRTAEFSVDDLTIYLSASWGWSEMLWVALISICLVFFVLVLLVLVMKLFGFIFTRRAAAAAPAGAPAVVQGQLHEEEIAAIATALKLYSCALHDRESEVLTILNIKRAYSPWNSKIHSLTQLPDKK